MTGNRVSGTQKIGETSTLFTSLLWLTTNSVEVFSVKVPRVEPSRFYCLIKTKGTCVLVLSYITSFLPHKITPFFV